MWYVTIEVTPPPPPPPRSRSITNYWDIQRSAIDCELNYLPRHITYIYYHHQHSRVVIFSSRSTRFKTIQILNTMKHFIMKIHYRTTTNADCSQICYQMILVPSCSVPPFHEGGLVCKPVYEYIVAKTC